MRPVLVFDGECGICTRAAELAATRIRRAPGDFDVVPWQRADLAALGLTEAQCTAAVQWVDADSRSYAGSVAVAQALVAGHAAYGLLGRALGLPGVRALAAVVYRWVAANRYRLPGGTPACGLRQPR